MNIITLGLGPTDSAIDIRKFNALKLIEHFKITTIKVNFNKDVINPLKENFK